MSLKDKINTDIKEAMKAKKKDELTALRAIKSAILLAETAEGNSGELKEADEIAILTKAVKQRKDSAETFQKQDREDLANKELGEAEVIQRYLPQQLSEDELKEKLQKIISEVGASSPKDMGKVMGKASQALAGQAEGKVIASMVKTLLNS